MTKKPWLALSPIVFLLGFSCPQNVIASPQLIQTTECANCQTSNDSVSNDAASTNADSDYDGDNDFDNSQDFSQDQSADASTGSAPAQSQANNTPDQNQGGHINSADDGDEN